MKLKLLHEASLFVYGTLTDPHVRKRVIGVSKTGKKDVLDNFKKVKKGNFPNIVKKKDDEVEGQLVTSLSSRQLSKVDDWEEKYKRIEVTLRSGKKAFAYKLK